MLEEWARLFGFASEYPSVSDAYTGANSFPPAVDNSQHSGIQPLAKVGCTFWHKFFKETVSPL
jgi:hypothetical protein